MVISMNKNILYFKRIYKSNKDFIVRDITSGKRKIYILFFESLCDTKNIYDYVTKNIIELRNNITLLKDVIASPKLNEINNNEDAINYLENGFCITIFNNEMYAIEAKANIDRGITTSQTEQNLFGAKDSFCENFQKNLGTIKRRIKTKDFKSENIVVGLNTKTEISVLYIDKLVNKENINKIINKLNKVNNSLIDSSIIFNLFNEDIIFPTVIKTEKPSNAANYILDGYIVLLIDNYPFVLILDAKLKDFINPIKNDKFLYILRLACLLITIITPGLYIAMTNFNPETIPTSLLINFAYQRFGVPFPSFIEALIMLLICEIIRETDIRFPNAYGSAASILGALILGDAAVSAGIVSPIMIIIIAITFITNLLFTQVKFIETLRILRLLCLIIGSIIGLYGIALFSILVIAYLSNVETMKGSYL